MQRFYNLRQSKQTPNTMHRPKFRTRSLPFVAFCYFDFGGVGFRRSAVRTFQLRWVSLGVYWISIAVVVRSLDPSLFAQLISTQPTRTKLMVWNT
jgi:hypothetical protein